MLDRSEINTLVKNLQVQQGDFLSHNDINHLLELSRPEFDAEVSIKEYDRHVERYHVDRLNSLEAFKEAMLETRQMYMKSVWSKGYTILRSNQHVDEARGILRDGLDRAFSKTNSLLTNTRLSDLNMQENLEHVETTIRITSFQNLVNNSRQAALERKKLREGE